MSMSIQSDVEILSVQAVEYYAQKHHLSEGEVFDLFCKRQGRPPQDQGTVF